MNCINNSLLVSSLIKTFYIKTTTDSLFFIAYIFCFQGKRIGAVEIPGLRITSCCFGGKNYDELFVTCSRYGSTEEELQKFPLSGSVFKVTGLGVKGYPSLMYEGTKL
jgi:sugar lactone lactonase YvrE